jgi:hypothetical protein
LFTAIYVDRCKKERCQRIPAEIRGRISMMELSVAANGEAGREVPTLLELAAMRSLSPAAVTDGPSVGSDEVLSVGADDGPDAGAVLGQSVGADEIREGLGPSVGADEVREGKRGASVGADEIELLGPSIGSDDPAEALGLSVGADEINPGSMSLGPSVGADEISSS